MCSLHIILQKAYKSVKFKEVSLGNTIWKLQEIFLKNVHFSVYNMIFIGDISMWTQQEKLFLKQNAHIMKDKDIAFKLNKTLSSVRKMRQRLNIPKQQGRLKDGKDG